MPKPKEQPKPRDPLTGIPEPLHWPSEPDEEVELMRPYYPHLNPDVTPREWDEPPWGHGN